MIQRLKDLGMSSDMAYGAALVSIALSIGVWGMRKGRDTASAERLGIFIGLWAPTFAVLGNALQQKEN